MIADAPRRDTIGESSFDEVEPGNGHTLLLARRIRTRSARFHGRGAGGSGNDNSGIVYLPYAHMRRFLLGSPSPL